MHGHSHSHQPLHSHGHSHAHALPHEHAPPPPYPSAEQQPQSPHSADHPLEGAHQATVQACWDSYVRTALSANQRRRADFWSLAPSQRELLGDYNALLAQVDQKLQLNGRFVSACIDANPFPPPADAALSAPAPTEADHERLRSTLRQCARDWSELGRAERDTAYNPILEALNKTFNHLDASERSKAKVLVPGAGLGRLAWEIVRAGFSCQANEFSLFMLIASSFILNGTTSIDQFSLYPYLHSFSNSRSKEDLLAPILIPDVLPSDISGSQGDFSFASGDFLQIYAGPNESEAWDAVATCFFIDTARNIVDYLEMIWRLLKPGGVWINCGPTLWHFENTEGTSSIELTLDDVKALATRIGFVLSDEREVSTSYTSNARSLLRHEYTAAFWIATKPQN